MTRIRGAPALVANVLEMRVTICTSASVLGRCSSHFFQHLHAPFGHAPRYCPGVSRSVRDLVKSSQLKPADS